VSERPVSDVTSHIFVCYSSKDEAIARSVVDFLESYGLICWISVRDVPTGQNYQETIVHALERAQGIVFLFSEHSSQSGEIKKELSIGGSMNTPVFPVRLSPITPTGALRYELATRQWIDIFPDRERALRKLVETIQEVLAVAPATAARDVPIPEPTARTAAVISRAPGAAAPPAKRKPRARAPLVAADSQEFEAMRAMLARHIGPIAKIFVQKAATEARSLDEFCERLATHVSTPTDRTAFLQAARARLAVKSP
jgi:hypothetical protein